MIEQEAIFILLSSYAIFLKYREINSGDTEVTPESLSQQCLCSSVPPGITQSLELIAGLGKAS